MKKETGKDDTPRPMLASVIERNIETLLKHRQQEDLSRSFEDKIADAVTGFTGSMLFVYVHLLFFGLWIAVNVGWINFPRFDPNFAILAVVASTEAIFLSTFVLISQNRMMKLANKRADLDLQVSLLAEHEVTKLIKLVTAITEHLGLEFSQDPEIQELSEEVHPERVLDTIEKSESQ